MEVWERQETLEDVRLSIGSALATCKESNAGGWLNETIHTLNMVMEDISNMERREFETLAEEDGKDRAALEAEYWNSIL